MHYCSNISCDFYSKKAVEKTLLSSSFHTVDIAGFSSFYTLITLISFAGNALLCYVIIGRKVPYSFQSLLICNLAVSNLFLTAIWIPLIWRPTYALDFDNNDFFCKCSQSFPGINVCCTAITIFLISFYYVAQPFRFCRFRWTLSIPIILFIWLLAIFANVTYFRHFGIQELQFKNGSIDEETSNQLKQTFHQGMPINGSFVVKVCIFSHPTCRDLDDYHHNIECLHIRSSYQLINNCVLTFLLYVLPMMMLASKFIRYRRRIVVTGIRSEVSASNFHIWMFIALCYSMLWLPKVIFVFYFYKIRKHEDYENYETKKLLEEIFSAFSFFSVCAVPAGFGIFDPNYRLEMKISLSKICICLPEYHHHKPFIIHEGSEVDGPVIACAEPLIDKQSIV